jgi:(E)-4-hydroxy-3-methylbut-2-enyl-diphosphate synthase
MAVSRETVAVKVGNIGIGGDNPVRIQSMADTATENISETVKQLLSLFNAGSELLRITVNTPQSAKAVPEIKRNLLKEGCNAPLIGDFHYNGHILLKDYPKCAEMLDKFRINPGNTGKKDSRTKHFIEICEIAKDLGKPIRIGVNSGSVDEDLLNFLRKENEKREAKKSEKEIIVEGMIKSALNSLEMAIDFGMGEDKIILSCKTTEPLDLVYLYRKLAKLTKQPLHLGLTEAGGGIKGIVWSTTPLAILLSEGIGETIRVSLTPSPESDRTEEVFVAKEILESLNLRNFSPKIVSCPGCGRTSSNLYRQLAKEIEIFVKKNSLKWVKERNGVEKLKIAVMGCIVNGIGEGKNADIGISLPGSGENPQSVIFEKGKQVATVKGDIKILLEEMKKRIEKFIEKEYPFIGEKDGKRPAFKNKRT